jgi:hypothetical protein
VNYPTEGLNSANHAPYCRDALAAVLKACPAIGGLTFRTHGESGVAEGSYDFWKTVFDGVVRAGRPIELDLHPKGIDQTTIDLALATGMPVKLSPKYWRSIAACLTTRPTFVSRRFHARAAPAKACSRSAMANAASCATVTAICCAKTAAME